MSDIEQIEAIYEATEPPLRPRMLVLLSDFAKSDAVSQWAREKRAELDPEYRLRKGLRSFLVDTLPTQP